MSNVYGGGGTLPSLSWQARYLNEKARRDSTPSNVDVDANADVDVDVNSGPTYGSSNNTAANRRAAGNLGAIGAYNAQSIKDQAARGKANYDLADQQNTQLAQVQKEQNSRKASADRFGQQKKLQSSVSSLRDATGNAMQGSGTWNIIDMLRTRLDLDNNEVWNTLTQNQNAVRNALDEALNANVVASNDLFSNAEAGLRGIEADTSAQLNNIDPDLFVAPGTGAANFGSAGYANANMTPAHMAALAGYLMPASNISPKPASKATGNSYYDKYILNPYNRRA